MGPTSISHEKPEGTSEPLMKSKEPTTEFLSIAIGVIFCILLVYFKFDDADIHRNPKFAVASGMVMAGLTSMFVYFLLTVCFSEDE